MIFKRFPRKHEILRTDCADCTTYIHTVTSLNYASAHFVLQLNFVSFMGSITRLLFIFSLPCLHQISVLVCVLGLCQNFLLFIFPSSAVNCLVKTIANKKTIDFHHNFMHVHLNCTNTQFAFCHMCNNKSCEIYTISTVFFVAVVVVVLLVFFVVFVGFFVVFVGFFCVR